MSPEWLTAVASVITALVIAATAVAAVVQLRHMRTSNAIESQLAFRAMLDDDAHRKANAFLRTGELTRVIEDPAFRYYLYCTNAKLPVPGDVPKHYQELFEASVTIGNSFELIGGMVRNNIVPKHIFLQNYWWVVVTAWDRLKDWVALLREYSGSPGMYEDFEYLTVLSQQWSRKHPDSYAKGAPRITLANPYPLQEEAWFKP